MKTKLIIIFTFAILYNINAQIVNHNVMYEAYLANDMKKWGVELKKYVENDSINISDKMDICNYMYGYIATILNSAKESESEWWLDTWDKYIEELNSNGYEGAETHVFRSAWHAYQYTLHPGKLHHAAKSLREADKALDIDEENPLALSLKGNIKFYTPKLVGGNKKDAAEYYEKAITEFEKAENILYRWNKMATKLCLVQTYEKLGETDKAISYSKKIIEEEPNFKYMRDVYLPMLIINYEE